MALQPDLIVFTGDFITAADTRHVPALKRLLAPLRAPLGILAVLGNHDFGLYAPLRQLGLHATNYLQKPLEECGLRVLRNEMVAVTRRDHGTIAYGIGGDEARGPAEWFRDVFAYARDGGLHLVCHAGETMGPESIWAALEIGAERIGHGITAVRDLALLARLRESNIPLEVSITSNVCTGVAPSLAEHPVRRLYDAGVPIVLNTDDPSFFHTSLVREYELAQSVFGLPAEELAAASFRYAFAAPAR